MAILASWSGAGLADGTAVTTSTAGTGDTPFGTVTASAFTVKASGGLHAPRIQMDQAAATAAELIWGSAVVGTSLTAWAARCYVELSALPPANGGRLVSAYTASNALLWFVDVTTAGLLRLRNAGGTAVSTSAAALPTSTELRIEGVHNNGAVVVNVYTGNGGTVLTSVSSTGLGVGSGLEAVRFGMPAVSPTWGRLWLDEFAVANTAAEIGPVVTPPRSGTGTITATAALTGSGRKIASGTGTASATATASGTGFKRASGTGTITATASLTGSGSQPNPPTFPDAPLATDVELKIGDTWERITGDVLTGNPITIERGRADEAAEVAPSKLSLTLRNTGGKYSPRNPRSPYFGLIGRNTPIRVRVNHPDVPSDVYAYMPGRDGHYFSTPDAAGIELTTGVDVRMEITPDSWRPTIGMTLASKRDWHGSQDSWAFVLRTDGLLRLRWTSDGVTAKAANSTVPVPAPVSGRLAVRARLGASTGTYTFYTAPSLAGPWTQLGDVVAGASGGIFSGTAPLEIGSSAAGTSGFTDLRMFHGRLHAFQLANLAGAVIADPGITEQAEGDTEWTAADGLPWSAHGGARLLRPARFHGEVSTWPQKWSLGGHQITTPIEGSGVKRRLGQGRAAVQSTLRRSIPQEKGLVAYWPMEDAGGQFASAMIGAGPLRVTRDGIDYASDSDFVGSAPIPRMGTGRVAGAVPGFTPQPGSIPEIFAEQSLVMLLHMPDTALDGPRRLLALSTTGQGAQWDLWYSAALGGVLGVTVYDRDGAKIHEQSSGLAVHGKLLRIALNLTQFTTNSTWDLYIQEQGKAPEPSFGAGVSATMGVIRTVTVGDPTDLGDTSIGHIAIYNRATILNTVTDDAFQAFTGELAADRLVRLADENDVPMTVVGQPPETAAMGPQKVGALLDLLEDCADADGGILGEARDEIGLEYRTCASLYNQVPALTLTYGEPGLAAPFEPVDDDQGTVNDATITREGGSSARVVVESGPLSVLPPPDGVGTYDLQETVNVADDDVLPDLAGWRVHTGTWDQARYPSLGVKLHKAPGLIAAAVAMDFGDRATVGDLPPWLPPGPADALVQGYVEVLELLRWRIDCNASPAGPWNVGVLDDAARFDTAGSELAAGASSSSPSLSVATTQGPIWTTSLDEFPFDVMIDGERVTVTAISGASSPQTFTVVRAVNGIVKAHAAGADVALADPTYVAI
ncbi:hypothetical protein [Actinomadura decatromicini]|uniref:Uncharacterized protein n=1 Tax=Actinomadura decatromicini TaxID=2604572 RepID=A0A5D3FGD3_9ACTN|nr:hypothetical protein [Actinomadura decatromicini]TYK47149.1 hypothetical protein FXF68_25440 [Actinomadura decatromicini]